MDRLVGMKEANSKKPESVGAFEAKTHLSRLLRATRAGKSFIITQHGKAVAELRPVQQPKSDRKWGDLEGQITVADDFCAPIDDMKEYME